MFIEVVKSKIHRVTVTQANLNYIGSITIDEDLMDAANIIANEKVSIVNNNNGERFETYVIKGERGSGVICLSRRPKSTTGRHRHHYGLCSNDSRRGKKFYAGCYLPRYSDQ